MEHPLERTFAFQWKFPLNRRHFLWLISKTFIFPPIFFIWLPQLHLLIALLITISSGRLTSSRPASAPTSAQGGDVIRHFIPTEKSQNGGTTIYAPLWLAEWWQECHGTVLVFWMEFHTLFIETLYDLLCAAVGLNFTVTVRVNHGNSAESFLWCENSRNEDGHQNGAETNRNGDSSGVRRMRQTHHWSVRLSTDI